MQLARASGARQAVAGGVVLPTSTGAAAPRYQPTVRDEFVLGRVRAGVAVRLHIVEPVNPDRHRDRPVSITVLKEGGAAFARVFS